MIEYIRVKNFKSLLDANFSLEALNVFSGLNGMGKSSLIQALLLLRQSHERNALANRGLLLQGEYISLGTGADILSEDAVDKFISFSVKWKGRQISNYEFNYNPKSDLQPIKNKGVLSDSDGVSLYGKAFQYISADRISPRSSHSVSDFHLADLNNIGCKGEYVIHFLAESGLKPVPIKELIHPEAGSSDIKSSLDAWMSEISPGIRINAKIQAELNAASLSYGFVKDKEVTAEFKPQNVGFGITYCLPVIVAILRAKPGDLLIVENPESHLHPAGQSTIGKLCAIAAQNGVQIFIETHSDHFLNGVRVAVKNGLIKNFNVALFFLDRKRNSNTHQTCISSPRIDSDGKLDKWPDGFFDEWTKQLSLLLDDHSK